MLFRPQGESFFDLLIDEIDQVKEGFSRCVRNNKAMKKILIVFHSKTGGTYQMAEAAARGAASEPEIGIDLTHAADAGSDGENAARQIQRIAAGWRLKAIADPTIVCTHAQTPDAILAPKQIGEFDLKRCEEVGATLASGLALGIF